jgi:DNA polymerase-3 subunit delta
MGKIPPVIYLFHGEDEYAISQTISELESRVGDPAYASMNITRLVGNVENIDQLPSVTNTMPFLTNRRLVILEEPLQSLTSPSSRKHFIALLEQIPQTTALVVVINRILTSNYDRRKGKIHWLEQWAGEQGERVYMRAFPKPQAGNMVDRVQDQARKAGGQITPRAAQYLSNLVNDDPRVTDQEIQKLLMYVNYERPVDIEDVEKLTPDQGQGNIFALVDALGNQNTRLAMEMLHRLLESQEAMFIFSMIVRQFRLLLLTREILDDVGNKGVMIQKLKIQPFVADKLIIQSRHFTLQRLEATYQRLLDVDESIKTGMVPDDLALDTLVATLTRP